MNRCSGSDSPRPFAPSRSLRLPARRAVASPAQSTPAAARRRVRRGGAGPEAGAAKRPAAVDFQETEFAESERSRDPFRSFAKMFVDEARTKIKSQREVVLDSTRSTSSSSSAS